MYDEETIGVRKLLPELTSETSKEWTEKYFALIAEKLAPCDCGGSFT